MNLILFYISGLGLSFSPCTLPLLPIALSLAVGENGDKRNLIAYCCGSIMSYVGICYIYQQFHFNLQLTLGRHHWVSIVIASVLAFMVVSLLVNKNYTIPIPMWLYRWINSLNKLGFWMKGLFGFFSTLIISPCMTIPLSAILTYIDNNAGSYTHLWLGLMLGLGINTPLILLGMCNIQFKVPQVWFRGFQYLLAVALSVTIYRLLV